MAQSFIQNDQIEQLINLSDYPLSELQSQHGQKFVKRCRQNYLDTGLCLLSGFIRPAALELLSEEANRFSENAYFCKSTHNAYLTDQHEAASQDDILNRQEQTYVGSVAYDFLSDDSLLKQLYLWDPLKEFIRLVLGKEKLYRFADPFGACSINVFTEGGEHGWHFDESEFTVTLMLQSPEQGGSFEYVPKIRGLKNEHQMVEDILNGHRDAVITLPFTPGTLLIFGGNQTIHRVTRVSGDRPRLVPVLCYSETENAVNSEAVRELFWGRKNPGQSQPA